MEPSASASLRPAALRLATIALLLLALAGCGSGGGSSTIDDASAQELEQQGEYRAAAAAYEQLARRNRRQRDSLLLRAAESLREEADWAGVDRVLAQVKRARLLPAEAVRADLLLAEIALSRNEPERALALSAVPDGALDPELRIRAAEIRARALAASGKAFDSAAERMRLNALLPAGERGGNEADLLETLATIEASELNLQLSRLEPRDALRPWVERALRLKGAVPARVIPRPTRQAGTLMPDAGSDAPWRREGYAVTPRVALLLPLTGPLAAAAAAVRDGFLAAYYNDGEQQRASVRVFDTLGSAEGALAAYAAAVSDGSVRVVGPLSREEVTAVQSQLDLTIPVLALNHPEDGTAPPVGSQQFGLAPDDEAALAAEYAANRNLRRAAILAGTEEWSERAALAFRAQIETLGGEIVGESRLPPDGIDLSGPISQALGSTSADVIFLAVRPNQGRLLVPQLRTRGFDRLPMLATSHIYSGTVNRPLDRDLNGVEFCDSPWMFGLTTGLPPRDVLARKLPSAVSAPRLFAFGMDAYRLLPYLDWLAQNNDAYLPGASGQLAIDEFGRVRRLLTWMRFVDGLPRAADGALSAESSTP